MKKTDLYKNKYRISSTRLKNWDYRSNGAYFITICTNDRINYFGEVENGEMQLSEIGKLAHQFWAEIPQHFPFIELDAFIIMPNHTHGILIINNIDDINPAGEEEEAAETVQTLQCNVSTVSPITPISTASPIQPDINIQMKKISPKAKSISTIIRSYKSATTKHARKINADFSWQSRFHDHIIRNDTAFTNIQNYIINNPKKWKGDKNNPL